MRVIDRATGKNLTDFINDNAEPGSTVITNSWTGYSRLGKLGYVHDVGDNKKAQEALPNAHRRFSPVKR
jgi:hypothetical protein